MPTENRSNNTEQMVSVLEKIDDIAERFEIEGLHSHPTYKQFKRLFAELKAAQHQGEAEGYPPCDYCGLTPSHHPWHGSGLLEGVENRHIHACNKCRGKLPAHQGEPVETAVFNDPLYNAESDARNASSLLEEVLEWFDDGVGRSQAEFKLMRKIGAWLGRSAPSADGESDECAHSYANGVGCPECGKEFGAEPSAPKCKYCGDTGQIMVGRSGDTSDGDAPVLGPCEDCERGAPVERVDPVREALRAFVVAAYPVANQLSERGHNWSEAYLDEALLLARTALEPKQ